MLTLRLKLTYLQKVKKVMEYLRNQGGFHLFSITNDNFLVDIPEEKAHGKTLKTKGIEVK